MFGLPQLGQLGQPAPNAPLPEACAIDGYRGPLIEFAGELTRNAEVRSRTALDGLHCVPVVCIEIKSTVQGVTRLCHAEQPFTDATRRQAEQLAKTLLKKRRVTVTAPIAGMCITFPNAASIALHLEH